MKKTISPDLMNLLKKYDIVQSDDKKEYTQEELNQLIEKVNRLIQKKKQGRLNTINPGNKRFLTNVMKVVLIGAVTAATYFVEKGYGTLPGKDENEKKRGQAFAFEVLVEMIIGTRFIDLIFKTITETAATNEKNQKVINESLKLTTILLAIHAATKGNEDRIASLIDAFKEDIIASLDLIGNYLNEGIMLGSIPKGISEELSLKLHQSKLALERGEVAKFIEVCKGALGLLGLTEDLLQKNFKEIEFLSKTLLEAFSTSEEKATTLAQAM